MPQSSVGVNASSSASASSCARLMTERRKPCGVWQRPSDSRGGIDVISPPATSTIVSAVGTTTPSASAPASAATQSAMIRWSTSGRAASWNSTLQSAVSPLPSGVLPSRALPSGPLASRALRCSIARLVEPGRSTPPGMMPLSLRYLPSSTSFAAPIRSAGSTARTSSTPGAASNAATQCSSSVRPASN